MLDKAGRRAYYGRVSGDALTGECGNLGRTPKVPARSKARMRSRKRQRIVRGNEARAPDQETSSVSAIVLTPLISSEAIDHIIPGSLNRKNFKRYEEGRGSVTEFKEFEDRSHAPHHCRQLFLRDKMRPTSPCHSSAENIVSRCHWSPRRCPLITVAEP